MNRSQGFTYANIYPVKNTLESMEPAAVIRRIANEFREIPGLCLTLPQAARFFGLSEDVCEQVLTQLAADRVVRRSGTYYAAWRGDFIGTAFVSPTTRHHYR